MGANLFSQFGDLSLDAVYTEQSSELKMATFSVGNISLKGVFHLTLSVTGSNGVVVRAVILQ